MTSLNQKLQEMKHTCSFHL